MAHGHGSDDGAVKLLWWTIFAFLVMFVIWYYTGGPSRTDNDKPFMKPLDPVGSGETYGPSQK